MFSNKKEIADNQKEIVEIKKDIEGLFNNMTILMEKLNKMEEAKKESQYMG